MHSKNPARQGGLSMVELMVAMALGVFLLLALVQILLNGRDSFGAANNLSRLQENGRIATGLIITDLKRAGYYGGNSSKSEIEGTSPPAVPNASCETGDTSWVRMVERPIEGLDDTNAGYACITAGNYLRGDVVTTRYTAPWEETGALDNTRIYLRSSLFQGRIFAGSAAANAANTVDDQPQNVRELQAFSYFVGNSGRSCNGAPIPSLFRVRVNDVGLPTVEELLPGVENLQVQYGDEDQFYDADEVVDWEEIRTAQIWVLVRAECAENGYTDARTIEMGDDNYAVDDGFRRQLYSSSVMLRNFRN